MLFTNQGRGSSCLGLESHPTKFRNWQKLVDQVPLDPWNHEYQYIVPAPNGIQPYGVYSFGKDGISNSNGNDPDDLNSWSERSSPPIPHWFPPLKFTIPPIAVLLVAFLWHRSRRALPKDQGGDE